MKHVISVRKISKQTLESLQSKGYLIIIKGNEEIVSRPTKKYPDFNDWNVYRTMSQRRTKK